MDDQEVAEAQNLMVGVAGWKSLQEWTSLQIGNRDHLRLMVEEEQERKEVRRRDEEDSYKTVSCGVICYI